ncbi:MAG: hypothetical protein JO077_05845 [Verrucomicrobia bacterium]|nr:hypothetical protein [Verrucomicrobiota bacterium]
MHEYSIVALYTIASSADGRGFLQADQGFLGKLYELPQNDGSPVQQFSTPPQQSPDLSSLAFLGRFDASLMVEPFC